MKQTLKRLTALLVMAILMITLCACGSSADSSENSEEAEFIEIVENFIEQYASMDQTDKDAYAAQYGETYPFYVDAANAWKENEAELGEFKEVLDSVYSLNGDIVSIESTVAFEKKNATINIMLRQDDQSPTAFVMDPEKTMGETMKQAGVNTVIGIGTVFLVLLFLSFLISLFRFIPGEGFTRKKKNDTPVKTVQESAPVAAVEDTVDDQELIAVIAAAIAAAENTSTDDFVVRSVKKVRRNSWKRA